MSAPLKVTIDPTDFDELKKRFGVTKQDVKDALGDATRDTLNDLKTREDISAEVAAALKIDASVIKNRITLRYRYESGYGMIWFGLNPVSLAYLNAKQDKAFGRGVTAGPVTVRGAFISPKLHDQVFKRTGAKRLPIVKQVFNIADVSRETIRSKIFPMVKDLFQQNVESRLEDIMDRKRRRKK